MHFTEPEWEQEITEFNVDLPLRVDVKQISGCRDSANGLGHSASGQYQLGSCQQYGGL